jgi:hypothetical protein
MTAVSADRQSLPAGSTSMSILDALRSLKQPIRNGASDVAAYLRLKVERRQKLRAGDIEGALTDDARLVTGVQFARESLKTYRSIGTLIEAHPAVLADHRPDDSPPEQLVLFVGQSRSGHSLVGSLIDAHPDAIIAHELHALKHLIKGAEISELSRAIQLNAHLFDLLGRAYTGYDYAVPGQWQGRHRKLALIGDKKGNGTTRLLRRHPGCLDRLEERIDIPLRLINVIRDPFDNIATKARRTGVSAAEAARRFFANVRTLDALTSARPAEVKTIYLNDLIERPKDVLADLVTWLGLSTDEPGYLDAAASLIFERPKRTRHQVNWPEGLIERIKADCARSPTLARFADETV